MLRRCGLALADGLFGAIGFLIVLVWVCQGLAETLAPTFYRRQD